MNEFTASTDFTNIYAEDSAGNQVKVGKSAFAESIKAMYPKSIGTDANNIVTVGVYSFNSGIDKTSNLPSGAQLGMLLVFEGTRGVVAQIYMDLTNDQLAYRIYSGGSWTVWRTH